MYGEKKYEVVISGLSGLYPECDDIEELWTRLMNKEDMVTVDGRRWVPGEFDVPPGTGKIKHPEHFDMTFFGIHRKLCEKMDPYTRLLCEQGYRAICDAGVNPRDLDGTSTAVIMSSFQSEPELDLGATLLNQGSYNVLAFSRTMQANRFSYFLNTKGPSFQMDNSGCGGIQAIQYAVDLISNGMCSAAVVGSCSLIHKPEASFHYQMIGRISEDCMTRSFSADASGYARSEACVSVFLQRKDHAKRIYGTILGADVACHGSKTVHFPAHPRGRYEGFLHQMYKDSNVDPKDLVYIEAHGAASKTLDALELNSISKALTKQRSKPLLVGSIKSNVGYTEGCSSMVSLTKVLMALDKGIIPPNINYSAPNPDVPDLGSGKLKVVDEPTTIEGGIAAVAEFGVTGNCAHLILKGNEKKKSSQDENGKNQIPRLVIMSGRNENTLTKNIKDLETRNVDEEFVLLANSLYKEGIKNHAYRGYSVINGQPNSYNMIGSATGGDRRPIWFMYSGMGSQWPSMAKSLMALPIFADAINKCHKILEPKGVNLLDILCRHDASIFDTILNSFVGIAAVQIGLTDVLRAIGIVPDGIIGHSVGELGCAYADGCMTAEQMILAAHARGRASVEAKLIKGMMAAVGAGYNQIKNILPEPIEVACRNSKDSCTLSGPAEDMAVFIDQLKAKGMFAKLVNVANIAYHSRYIKPAAPALLKYLKEILPTPVKRSSKWVSSSNLECNWNTDLAQHSSAEYHTNNLLSSVLFEEASSHIPSDAIVIEIAPHGLLQAIVKRSLPKAVHIPLTSRFDPDNLMFLLSAIGKMYVAGISVDLQALYPFAKFPVGRGTPALSPFIDWSREVNFFIKREMIDPDAPSPLCRFVSVNTLHDDFNVLASHKINGKSIIPSSFHFNEIVDIFMSIGNNDGCPIVMENIKCSGFAEITPETPAELRFQLLPGRGNVVVTNNTTGEVIFEGNIKTTDAAAVKDLTPIESSIDTSKVISHHDMVNLMKCAGVERNSTHISLDNVVIGNDRALGIVRWEGDLGKFLMSLLTIVELLESKKNNVLKLFHAAGQIAINLPVLTKLKPQDFTVEYDILNKRLQCKGVRISLIECKNPGLGHIANKEYFYSFELPKFVPYINKTSISYKEFVTTCTQLVVENTVMAPETVIKITEIGHKPELHDELNEIQGSIRYGGHTSLTSFATEQLFLEQCSSSLLQDGLWIVCEKPPSPSALKCISTIKNGFLLAPKGNSVISENNYKVVFETLVEGEWYYLYSIKEPIKRQYEVVNLSSNYLRMLEHSLLTTGTPGPDEVVKTVILWGQVDTMVTVDTLLEETKELPNSQLLQYWLFHGNSPEVDFNDTEFKSQIERDVRMNILEDGQWGSLRLVPSNASERSPHSSRPSKFYHPISAVAAPLHLVALGLNVDDNLKDDSIPELGYYDYVSSDKIMGIGAYNPDSKTFTPDRILSWPKKNQWSSKEAATIPLLYSLASYILKHSNNAECTYDDSILVNRALLPLSQAIISLALFENMDVHATVYGEEERQKLLKLFPKLNPKNIYDCSSVAFFVELLQNSDKGVYKVINNFDDTIMVGPCAKCAKPLGVIIYVSQALINKGAAMGMSVFNSQVIAKGVSGDILMKSNESIKIEIRDHIAKALQKGGISPIRAVASLPSSTLNTEAIGYLKSNPNKVVVDTKNIENSIFLQGDSKIQVIVEGKIQIDLSLDILEWLLKRGSRKVLLFVRQSHPSEANSLRLQSLREQYKCAEVDVRPANNLSTKTHVEKFIDECSAPGPAMVFFLGSGLKEKIEFFDEILSNKSPECNMICIGKGGENVCERRKKNCLPALYIRCSTANLEGVNLVQYLDSLIKDSSKTPVILVKKCPIQSRSLHGLLADLKYVPASTEDLSEFMSQSMIPKARFVGIPSCGPPVHHNREVYPMFLIPGLRPNRLHKMASQLFCPVMEARIPASATSIDQIASELAAQMLALPHNMFTLTAEGWGGILALQVAAKLEAKSKYVNVVLLDADPASIVNWSDSLLKNEVALFRKYLQVPPGIESNKKKSSWDEELEFAVAHSLLKDDDQKSLAIECLKTLRKRLQSAVDAKPPSKKLKIKCHTFGLSSHVRESHGLEEYLLENPTIHTKDSKSADDMIDSDVAIDVNTLLLYEHTDAANPPIDEYLGCNVIKKYLPHWQSSLLYRVRE